jgi:hypothetical protein
MEQNNQGTFGKDVMIGTIADATALYAFPNNATLGWTLEQTIEHWFRMTLARDGFGTQISQTAIVDTSADTVILRLTCGLGQIEAMEATAAYAAILPKIYAAGLKAYHNVIPLLKAKGLWDPRNKDWHFFMPMGLPMLLAKSVQFFHYPPQKMLFDMQDYLDDPVPYRVEDLLMANGVSNRSEAQTYECIVDGAPIAAPDDAGSAKGSPSPWGYIPINYFTEYQKDMLLALLHEHPASPGYTVPILVYGTHPNKIFSQQFLAGVDLGINQPTVVEIIPGLKTPVMGSKHPYGFYWTAQVGSDTSTKTVGDGHMDPQNCGRAVDWMLSDLISTNWLKIMADDPATDGAAALKSVTGFWTDPAQDNLRCALVQSQATLQYTNPEKTQFEYRIKQKIAEAACTSAKNNTCSFVL